VGRYAFIAAGSVVTRDVQDYALVMGNPARQQGWMSRHGQKLGRPNAKGVMTCPESGLRYREVSTGVVRCLDLDEEAPLPPEMAKSTTTYREFRGRAVGMKADRADAKSQKSETGKAGRPKAGR
jgi:UDP-2-acetamido-3-amino-2,3-dideoxy-glucuronate N-acetyltransferase